MSRLIFFTGGVFSSLGKGVAAASLAALLKARGFKVTIRKFDPYLNVDPGTMSPYQHGEVFVTNDGAETDLDLGHYERFAHQSCCKNDSFTTGKIYSRVFEKERLGDYLGVTVQLIPHITDEIKKSITYDMNEYDFVLCEIGGTVGDYELPPYLEAIRQLTKEYYGKTSHVHLSYIHYLKTSGELKTKPTQRSIKELLSVGLHPDILLCRSDYELDDSIKCKLSKTCDIEYDNVIAGYNVGNIYEVPIEYCNQGFDRSVLKSLKINPDDHPIDLSKWVAFNESMKKVNKTVSIAIVGKYTKFLDTYKSLGQAFVHAGASLGIEPKICWINSEDSEDSILEKLKDVDGILIPGGFGERGVSGKFLTIKYARENNIPFFGICFGMQIAVIEACRNLLNINASSTEFSDEDVDPFTDSVINSVKEPAIELLAEWMRDNGKVEIRTKKDPKGGTMRLGSYPCKIKENTLAHKIYGKCIIEERHRHRYEVNSKYLEKLEKVNFICSGFSANSGFEGKAVLPEIMEYTNHPFFICVQFHPEFKSRPFDPHPLFVEFLRASS